MEFRASIYKEFTQKKYFQVRHLLQQATGIATGSVYRDHRYFSCPKELFYELESQFQFKVSRVSRTGGLQWLCASS